MTAERRLNSAHLSGSSPEDTQSPSHSDPARGLNRRGVLLGGLGTLGIAGAASLLSACGGDDEGSTDTKPGSDVGSQLAAMFPRDVAYLAAGVPARLIYTIIDSEGVPALELPEMATFTVKQDGTQIGDEVVAKSRSENMPRPYLAFEFTFPAKGVYDVYAKVDGKTLNSPVIVVDASEVKIPQVGSPLPAAPTATTTNTLDVDPICTQVPACPFHEHNLADVVGTGKPIVLLLATPAYCQTTACGPILETLMEEAKSLPPEVIVIHSEVYKNPTAVDDINDATLAPLPLAYKMSFEPSLFVADAAGTLVARGDIALDAGEMREMLTLAR